MLAMATVLVTWSGKTASPVVPAAAAASRVSGCGIAQASM